LALLQAEASACVLELANVPNARWLFFLFAGRQNKNPFKFALSFLIFSLAPNGSLSKNLPSL
jgi:hypothetical protein